MSLRTSSVSGKNAGTFTSSMRLPDLRPEPFR